MSVDRLESEAVSTAWGAEQSDEAPLLRISDLHARVGSSHILEGINLKVDRGNTIALLGRNGAGKTSTLRAVLGFLTVTSGVVAVEGVDVTGRPAHEISQLGIGYVPEDRCVFHSLTVEENLRLAERRPGDFSHRAGIVYDLFPRLFERRRAQGGHLSGGEQQMLAIGRALIPDNHLLMIDEPMEGLAPSIVESLLETFAEIARTNSVLLVEQNAQSALSISDYCYVISQGKTIHEAPARSFLEDESRLAHLLGVHQDTP